ncbi:MAG: class I mannose-6-phosphate isomerase [Prevotellaceae bacterium]|nr:class I mannose-6-phosphate isomerase [Prevotellaceae bacterium]
MRKSNYDKFPSTVVEGPIHIGWEAITTVLKDEFAQAPVLVLELYTGTYEEEIAEAMAALGRRVLLTRDYMRPEAEVAAMTERFMTDDVLFGFMSNIRIEEYFNAEGRKALEAEVAKGDNIIIIGTGASLFADDAPVVYANMARWEIQMRFRRHEVKALGIDNSAEGASLQYKRGYFNDWNLCDRIKKRLVKAGRIQYWLDTNCRQTPKMISNDTFMEGINATVNRPFRVVPFFDPAPWGGQWMKDVCDLDREMVNYGWCFDCVPEENSLYFNIDGTLFELPSKDVVMFQTRKLLGSCVEARFGDDFPIRFDFLDTIGGGNLSLQVHPTNEFVHEHFGIHYTQDESYYLLDADEDAVVYLGLKKGVDSKAMIEDLRSAQRGEIVFDAEKYVNKLHAKKHDHYLIPGGTIHCSGAGSMVLEISSTPSIFTFKLWDWQRLGLDGKPRPINVERGKHVIAWERDTDFVHAEIANHFEVLSDADGVKEEKTGLHEREFIETRRHTFTQPVLHNTGGSVNVLNLVDGEEALVDSPTGSFEPFVVHYAETFIIPAHLGDYRITPCGRSEGKECMTIKAYVRF